MPSNLHSMRQDIKSSWAMGGKHSARADRLYMDYLKIRKGKEMQSRKDAERANEFSMKARTI